MFTPQTMLAWASTAIMLLYLWLTCAYALAARRSGRGPWWPIGLAGVLWMYMAWRFLPQGDDEFQLFPNGLYMVILALPILIITLHLFGYSGFPNAPHGCDLLLFRRPSASPTRSQYRPWESLGISVLAIALTTLSVVCLSARPCHWLDRTLQRSGCLHVLQYAGLLQDLSLSANGNYVAVASRDGIHVWRTTDGHRISFLPYPQGAQSVAFSPDSQLLASGGREHRIQLRDITGALHRELPTDDDVESLTFSPDGQLLSAGVGNSVVTWRVVDGQRLWDYPTPDEVYSVAFAPDGQELAVGTYGGALVLRQLGPAASPQILTTAPIYQLAYSPDGALLAGATYGDRLDVWQMPAGQHREVFAGTAPSELMWSVAFTPDGTYVVGGSGAEVLRIWRTADFALVATHSFTDHIHNVAVAPDNRFLVIGLWDGTIRLWRMTAMHDPD